MNFNKISALMLLCYVVIVRAETHPAFITLYCPPAAAIRATEITGSSWANYKYQAQVSIDFTALGGIFSWGFCMPFKRPLAMSDDMRAGPA